MTHRTIVVALAVGLFGLWASGADVRPKLANDGKVNVHDALQKAVDDLSAAGGGRLVLGPGRYLTHGFFLKSNVTLRLERGATLVGDSDRTKYPPIPLEYSELKDGIWQALIGAVDAENVAVEGEGTVDGRGATIDYQGPDRPRGLLFKRCRNVRVEGVTLKNPMSWTCYFKECVGVVARGVTIYSHQQSNNDGFDIESANVLIEDCTIDCGDDGVCLKSDNPDFTVENVEVRNCRIASQCCAFKIGTASNGATRNIRFHDCVIAPCVFTDEATKRLTHMKGAPGVTDETTGITGIALQNVDGGVLENVRVSNVDVRGYSTPILVRLGRRKPNRMKSGAATALSDVVIENVTGAATSRIASSVTGVPGLRVKDVTFRNVRLALLGGGTAEEAKDVIPEKEDKYPESYMFDRKALPGYAFYVRHADGVRFENCTFDIVDGQPDARVPVFADDAEVKRDHVLTIDGPVMAAEEGLLLGNGDLSVSVYQTADEIVFRLGKGDVWDRRMDFTGVPKPATIQEYRNGVLREGWKCNPFDGKGTVATKGTKDEKRMRELCQGSSQVIMSHPYPCPKPTGEVKLRYPADLPGPAKVSQRLDIERGLCTVELAWRNGVRLTAEAVVDPVVNVLSLKWNVTGWTDDVRIGKLKYPVAPVRVSVVREADPDPMVWASQREFACGHSAIGHYRDTESPTLPPPKAFCSDRTKEGRIEQAFYPDNIFKDGFRYRLTLDQIGESVGRIYAPKANPRCKDACVVLQPWGTNTTGEVAVFVTTSRDRTLDAPEIRPHAEYRAAAERSAADYWRKSRLAIPGDRALEDLWYATYHARRCILRPGTVPPGLFFPSSLDHYSHWHGDYHSNYNFHSIYWGDFTANRLDDALTYFDCCDFYVPVGRKIAKEYYGGRGVFFMLEGFPLLADDDFNGQLPLGRMAYMTGWTSSRYLEYWQYTRDRDWLAKRGYPMLKDCALFYLDFLLKAPHPDLPPQLKDGRYHAFPSIQGESAIPGDPMALCDKDQVMMHARHALYAAIVAAKALGVDTDLRDQWQERLDNLAEPLTGRLKGYEKHCFLAAPPEFLRGSCGRPYAPRKWDGRSVRGRDDESFWYFGHTMRWRIGILRDNSFVFERDWPEYRESLRRWAHANGLVWAMSLQKYGRSGGWTETLSCMAPLQEMMLQSWDGAIRLFPWWPLDRAVGFRNWRAQGAFLVDATCEGGRVTRFAVRSEKGEDCLVHGDWTVTDADGKAVATDRDEYGRLRFRTQAGKAYSLAQ